MKFDPDIYTITIRKEDVDGDVLYVGRVAEFPNLCAYENSYDEALSVIRDAINTVKDLSGEAGDEMPAPIRVADAVFSGRVTLRLPRSLHAHVDRLASEDGVSLNQYLVAAIANHAGQISGTAQATKAMNSALTRILSHSIWLAGKAFQGAGKTSVLPPMQQFSTGHEWRRFDEHTGVAGNA